MKLEIISVQSATIDGTVGEVVWRGTGDDESDGAALNAKIQAMLGDDCLEWLIGPCGTPDINGVIFSTFRARPEMWSDDGYLIQA